MTFMFKCFSANRNHICIVWSLYMSLANHVSKHINIICVVENIFVSLWLASFCLGQNHLYVKTLFTGSPLFKSISEILHWLQVRRIGSLSPVRMTCHPVRTLICPLFHLSGRRAIPSGQRIFPSRPFTTSRSLCSSLHPSRRRLVIDQLQIFFPKFK
jgi:hypothetical protein